MVMKNLVMSGWVTVIFRSRRICLLEDRDDRAVGAEDIAETHGRVLGVRMDPVHGLDHHLGDTLGRAHLVGRVDRLVG